MSLKDCTVFMVGQDGQTHEATVEAAQTTVRSHPTCAPSTHNRHLDG
jgi:hypothetical protein